MSVLVTCDCDLQLDTSYLELMLSQAVADKEGVISVSCPTNSLFIINMFRFTSLLGTLGPVTVTTFRRFRSSWRSTAPSSSTPRR